MASGGGGARLPTVNEPATWSAYICPFLQEVANRQGGGAPRSLQQIFTKSNKRPVNAGEFERLVSKYVSTLTPPAIKAALEKALPANSAYRAKRSSRNTAVQELIKGGVNTLAGLMTACRGHPAPPLQEALIDGGGEGMALETLFQSIFAAEHAPGTTIESVVGGSSKALQESLAEQQALERALAASAASAAPAASAASAAGGGGGNSNVEILEGAPAGSWPCLVCTTMNPPAATKCIVCDTPRGTPWTCKACTFQNPETYNACNMCGSAKQRKTRKRRGRKQMRSRRQRGGAKQIQRNTKEALIQNVNNKPERIFYSGLNDINASPPKNSYGRFKEWNDKEWLVQPPPRIFNNLTKKKRTLLDGSLFNLFGRFK